jgi:sterol desaturase/sphingolipid hydroxylase (fatty acid hydroxylase superfamily)
MKEMHFNWLAFAVPLFLLLMAIEYYVAKHLKRSYHSSTHSSVANISIGVAERLLDVFVTGVFYFVYKYLHSHFAVFNIKSGVFLWVLLLLLTDFIWYWYHRLAHEINILWAAHVVHHQSEDFNYTVSARITVFQSFIRTGFWCVLPIIGFPPAMITSMLLVHGLYPFFIHTRFFKNLGLLEYVFVTPSHHRVHHAVNDQYIDKNYGDVFILWDKLLGTFKKEEKDEPIKYGLTQQLNSYSFMWQHFHFFIEIYFAWKLAKTTKEKWQAVFGSPTKFNKHARGLAERACNIYRHNEELTRPLHKYVLWQLGVSLFALFVFTLFEKSIPGIQQVIFTGALFVTLVNCGAIMEQKKWVFYLEYSRLFLVAISVVLLFPGTYTVTLIVMSAVLLVYYFNHANERYLKWIYDAS